MSEKVKYTISYGTFNETAAGVVGVSFGSKVHPDLVGSGIPGYAEI
jgi:hypothetical protein